MARTFLYARVSEADQTTADPLDEVKIAGFTVDVDQIVVENVSGATPARERHALARLIDGLRPGDVLIVTKLDRLGGNTLDVQQTVQRLGAIGVRVHCLALGEMDLNSAIGQLTMGVIAAVAEFERDLFVERTQAGLRRARAEGRPMGRPAALNPAQQADVRRRLAQGETVSQVARDFRTTRQTIMRVRDRGVETAGQGR